MIYLVNDLLLKYLICCHDEILLLIMLLHACQYALIQYMVKINNVMYCQNKVADSLYI